MKFLKKLKSGNFWISIVSAGVLIAEVIFDFEIKTEYLNQIILGLMGALTMFGIVSNHGDSETVLTSQNGTDTSETKSEIDKNVSNIKSICDTVNLLLNKVSINSKDINENTVIENDKNVADSTQQKNNIENESLNNNNIDATISGANIMNEINTKADNIIINKNVTEYESSVINDNIVETINIETHEIKELSELNANNTIQEKSSEEDGKNNVDGCYNIVNN